MHPRTGIAVRAMIAVAAAASALSLSTPVRSAGTSANKAWVSNTGDGTITVVDLDTMTAIGAPLNVGDSPRGSRLSPDGTRLYVVNQHAEVVHVLDTATDAVLASTPVGGRPFRCDVTPDGTGVYAACHTTDDLWRLETDDDTAAQAVDFGTGGCQAVAVSPDGTVACAVHNDTDQVSFVRISDHAVVGPSLGVVDEPHDVAWSEDGSEVIVVGDVGFTVIDASGVYTGDSGEVVATSGASQGAHEEVRVHGGLAYATRLSNGESATGVDVIDMATRAYVDFINLGPTVPDGGANGLALSPDGTRAWVTRRDTNELVELDLVERDDTGRTLVVGAAPRSVSVLVQDAATPVPAYFLPKNVKLTLKGEGKDAFLAAGFFDDGGAEVDWTEPVTLAVGGFEETFTLVGNGAGTSFKFKGDRITMLVKPNLKGSSRGLFRLKIAKTTLSEFIDPDEVLELSFSGDGLEGCEGSVGLGAGGYRLGRVRGTLVAPAFFPAKATAKVSETKPDSLSFAGGFATDGPAPESPGTVRFAFGEVLSLSIPGSAFSGSGGVFTAVVKEEGRTATVRIDYLREKVTVKTKGHELGSLADDTVQVLFDPGAGTGAVVNTVRLGGAGAKRSY